MFEPSVVVYILVNGQPLQFGAYHSVPCILYKTHVLPKLVFGDQIDERQAFQMGHQLENGGKNRIRFHPVLKLELRYGWTRFPQKINNTACEIFFGHAILGGMNFKSLE